MTRTFTLIFCVSFLLAGGNLFAETYYADNLKGNNVNKGSKGQPWASLRHALKQLNAGDSLKIIDNGPSHPYREIINPKISGDREKFITISGLDSDHKPSIVGSQDWSGIRTDGNLKWIHKKQNTVILSNVPKPAALWITSTHLWTSKGVNGMKRIKEAGVSENLLPGEWKYSDKDKSLTYKLNPVEKIEDLHFEAVIDKTLLKNFSLQYIIYRDIRFLFSANTAIQIKRGSSHILLKNIEVHHAIKNGIVVKNGQQIIIEDCLVDDAQNNGIAFIGSKNNRLSNTIIRGCRISRVKNNDCITLHKDMKKHDIGTTHHIEGNVLNSCAEQGIDVTSGKDVSVINNTTYGNGDSGIVLGHWVDQVLVKNHLSVDDGRYAGILVNKATNVALKNNCILNSINHQLVLTNATNVVLDGNLIFQGRNSRKSVIDITKNSHKVRFTNNKIVSESSARGVFLRYLHGNDPINTLSYFSNNTWGARPTKEKRFYKSLSKNHTFIQHIRYYQTNKPDIYDVGLRLDNILSELRGNNCDLSLVPERHKQW